MTEKKKGFDRFFEERIIQAMILDNEWSAQLMEVFSTEYFDLVHTKKVAEILAEHYFNYKTFPSISLLESICARDIEDNTLSKRCIDYLNKMKREPLNGDEDYVKDKTLDFFRRQTIARALEEKILPKLESGEALEDTIQIFQDAVSKGTSRNIGYDYNDDEEIRFEERIEKKVPTLWKYLDEILGGGWGEKRLITWIGSAGCHAKGTKILMMDGSIKNVEDIVVGDVLVGPDGTSRNVLNLHRGKQNMMKIIPTKWEDFVVNEDHLLTVIRTTKGNVRQHRRYKEVITISVKEWMTKSKTFKKRYKLYKPSEPIIFSGAEQTLPLDPYILGLLHGDGCFEKYRIGLTTADPEIKNVFIEHLLSKGETYKIYKKETGPAEDIRTKKDSLWKSIDSLGLKNLKSGDKFVPESYKLASPEVRIRLLAGLVDTDGHLDRKNFEYVSKSKRLADDVVFISRSLGLNAIYRKAKVIKGVSYYRIGINGNIDKVPTKLPRKQSEKRLQIKNPLYSGFKYENVGVDDYFGFEVDKDNLYLDANFLAHHNSGKTTCLVASGAGAILTGRTVVHYTLELDELETARKYDACITGVEINSICGNKQKVLHSLKSKLPEGAKLIIKEYPMKSASIQTIKSHIGRLKLKGVVPDVIIIDYGDLLRNVEQKGREEKRHGLEAIWQDMKALAQTLGIPVITATQTNRSGYQADLITADQVSEDFSKIMTADVVITLARNIEQKAAGLGKMHIAKNRQGRDGQIFAYSLNTATAQIEMFDLTEEVEEEIRGPQPDSVDDVQDKLKKFMATRRK